MTLRDPYITAKCAEIEALLQDSAGWASQNDKLGAHLAAYLSVLTVGLLEDCIEHLVNNRVGRTNDVEVKNYINQSLRRGFGNPDWNSISRLLGSFSEAYQKTFSGKIAHNGAEADALQSILDNKNSLAHEGTENLQMSLDDMADYYKRVIPILETVEQILNP